MQSVEPYGEVDRLRDHCKSGVGAMNIARHRFVGSLLLPMIGVVAAVAALPAFADAPRNRGPEAAEPPARRMTMVRVGYGQAKPDSALITTPFHVEGESWDAVEKAQH